MCSLATRDKRLFVEASLVDRGQGVGDSKHHHRRRHHSLHCHTIFRRKSYGDFMHRNPHKGRPPVPNRLFFLTLFKGPLTPPPSFLNIYVSDYITDYGAK